MRKRIFEIIESNNEKYLLNKIYNAFMMIVILLSILPLCFKTTNTFLHNLEYIIVIIFIADYILRWITADYKTNNKSISSFLKYPFTPLAIIDFLSILPYITVLNQAFKILRILRLFRTLRIFKMIRYSKSFNILKIVFLKEKNNLITVSYLCIGYIFISALIMFSVENNSFNNYFEALYWATSALTTVGYGDVIPITNIGRLVSMVSSLVGVAFVALPSSIITAGYLGEIKNDNEKLEDT